MMRPLKAVGLFAGIGGLELGLQKAGHSSALLVELDPGAQAILRQRFPSARVTADVRDLTALPARTELLAAGFPCQDLSQAGRLGGIFGRQSKLVRHVFRLLADHRISWVVLENVPFMLKHGRGAAIRYITGSLERLGYRWAYRTVDARSFGVPQRRRRVFVVASLSGDPRDVLLSDDSRQEPPVSDTMNGFYWTEGNRGLGWARGAIPALKGGSGLFIPSAPAVIMRHGLVATPGLPACERLQGFPTGWTRAAISLGFDRRRWTYLGNAVCVPVARWVGKRLTRPGKYDPSLDQPLRMDQSWPDAAWYDGKKRCAAIVSPWPQTTIPKPLGEVLRKDWQPLSGRAAAGFLSRLEASSLRPPCGLVESLVEHIERQGATPLLAHLREERSKRSAKQIVPAGVTG